MLSRRVFRSFLLVSSLAFHGCRGPGAGSGEEPLRPDADAAGGQEGTTPRGPSQIEKKEFREVDLSRVTETLSSEDFVVAGCRFVLDDDHTEQLPVLPSRPVPAGLDEILSELERRHGQRAKSPTSDTAHSPGKEVSLAPVRTYELSVAAGWILDLDIEDPGLPGGQIGVRSRSGNSPLRFSSRAPELLRDLRRVAFAQLRSAMVRPLRPRPWHFAALARFLDLEASAPGTLALEGDDRADELRGEILEYLSSGEEAAKAADALVPLAAIFDEEELEGFLEHDDVALRVLALTRSALEGNRDAISEILALSLEYFGQERLFGRAARRIFPARLNRELYRKYSRFWRSGVDSLAYIQEIRGRLEDATFSAGEGWALGRRS
jgi:hypothetical protein